MEFRNQFLNPKQEAFWLMKCGVSGPCSNLSRSTPLPSSWNGGDHRGYNNRDLREIQEESEQD